jgi:hypothetical protein
MRAFGAWPSNANGRSARPFLCGLPSSRLFGVGAGGPEAGGGCRKADVEFAFGGRSAAEKALDERDCQRGHLLHWIVTGIGQRRNCELRA